MLAHEDHRLYRRLEADFDVQRALPVARGALGLMAVLRCWRPDSQRTRVALSANICHDVVAAVLGAECEPVFCDVDPSDGNVPAQEWQRARTDGASVALVTHLYGNPADVSLVKQYFSAPTCLVIDDAAQALGSRNSAGPVGGQGDVGLLSFGASKHIATGGAALLFKDSAFANIVASTLSAIDVVPESERLMTHARFRRRLDAARERLRREGDSAASGLDGLLVGYLPVLQNGLAVESLARTDIALATYPEARARRMTKAAKWGGGLKSSGLFPVGMGGDGVPWRYTCRLPGIDWRSQHALGQKMRALGLDVSHWYLPAHWMCGYSAGTLPGVERLAQEVFQFWVDDSISIETIKLRAQAVTDVIGARIRGEE
jgi:DegT/DnrJ/EryC1/StrS aminotransferase family